MLDVTSCPRCGTSLAAERFDLCPVCLLDAEIPPAQLGGGLELLEEIGRGGMGTVYRARDPRLDRTVAVKFLAGPLAAHEESRKRFEREARALARLNHPAIVAVHDFGEEGDQAYIVMEHVAGKSLAELLPLPEARALDVALQICDGLAYAHRNGIVHRDIKPSNVLLDADGRVKITDFGVARLVGADAVGWTITDPAGAVGTPHYMAPEVLTGAAADPRMDLYSLGVVLYEIVTGRRPVGTFEPLPGALDRVVRRALAPDPERRYASADEMRRDLEAVRAAPTLADLPADELNWLRTVALLLSLASAASLWAFLLSVTPRVVGPGEVIPLIMLGAERLADGRIVSRARFETGPTLAAVAAIAVAIASYGLLRRHWREAGLEAPEPGRAVSESRLVLVCGILSATLYGFRRAFQNDASAWVVYVPIAGGLIETVTLFLVWVAVLQAWRRQRPLLREAPLWLGFGLALVPPVVDLLRYLRAWHP
jgi:predicted Ser/Thr protein kinase